jgi:hypothetical protein|nr:MAG TPA: Protein of unknown function (DUF551) [Caudoviricetes sp.]
MTQNDRIEAAASAYRNSMNRLVVEAAGCEATFDAAIRLAFREGARFALENQWMSVDEEIPPTDEDLIVYVPEDYEQPTRCVSAYWDGEDWYTTDGEHIRPTHWMQLAKFPETE